MPTIRLTKELIERCETANKGYTKATFEALGWRAPPTEPWKWCPPSGWKQRMIGTEITEESYAEALRASGANEPTLF